MLISALAIDASGPWPTPDELGWFAVRQPGVVRFLEAQLADEEALALALTGAWRVAEAYQLSDGVPCPRLPGQTLDRARCAVAREVAGPVGYDGVAVRQPELCDFVFELLRDAPVPLPTAVGQRLAQALWAFIYALDEAVSGREIP